MRLRVAVESLAYAAVAVDEDRRRYAVYDKRTLREARTVPCVPEADGVCGQERLRRCARFVEAHADDVEVAPPQRGPLAIRCGH